MPRFAFASAALLVLAACSSGGSATTATTGGPTITMIATDSFGAANITVAAGSTITVMNNDPGAPHTATSEAAAGDYDGGIATGGFFFDTGDIASGASATITVPAGIVSGTVQPFFCKVHKAMMTPSDPTITIK